ncbi:MAG: CPBP family intramembrane glutamic endopeptidase [Actinomycetota bacterium]
MSTVVAIAAVLLVLVVINLWVHVGPTGLHVVTGPLAALLLLVLARAAGLTWSELGLGSRTFLRGAQVAAATFVAVAIVYAVAVAIPFTRGAFRDTRYRLGLWPALYLSLVAIPLGTVLFEEVAFRSVLWGLLARDFGVPVATAVSATLFGLWHVLPALAVSRTHTAVRGTTAGVRRVSLTVLATIVFTAIAGVVFAELRRRSGSLVAPIGLHWATNGLGVLAAARVWALSPGGAASTSGEVAAGDTPVAGPVSQPVWQRVVRRLSSRS